MAERRPSLTEQIIRAAIAPRDGYQPGPMTVIERYERAVTVVDQLAAHTTAAGVAIIDTERLLRSIACALGVAHDPTGHSHNSLARPARAASGAPHG